MTASGPQPDTLTITTKRNTARPAVSSSKRSIETYAAAPADVLYQEKTFELPLEHDVIVTGRMDQVNRIAGDKVEIIDYKTGKPKDEKAAAKDLQLGVYALAAREVLDLDPVRLVFYNLMTNEAVASTRDAKALKETKDKIAEVADQIRAREFSAKPGYGCGFCDYKPLCPAHEQLISIKPRRGMGTQDSQEEAE